MRIREHLAGAAARLAAAGCPDPRLDAAFLMSDALDTPCGALRLRLDEEPPGAALEWFEEKLARRLTGEPLQYVEGFAFFYGRKFLVDRKVLIPRPDTEVLCEAALQRIGPGLRVLDLCTGSGALAITFALEAPGAHVTGADISAGALEVARDNAQLHGAAVRWARGDLFEAADGAFDLIACNPPYLSDGDMAALQTEVSFEPRLALSGGADGLFFYRRIAAALPDRLNPGGAALFEVGLGQAGPVAALLQSVGRVSIVKDLSGADRVVTVERV
jgi:release factor glutamine methyltransferase